jgi:hypothetical protein
MTVGYVPTFLSRSRRQDIQKAPFLRGFLRMHRITRNYISHELCHFTLTRRFGLVTVSQHQKGISSSRSSPPRPALLLAGDEDSAPP